MIEITPTIAIDEDEIAERFIRASGPGGQNVNKVSTAVQIRFDARNSPSLPEGVRERLAAVAGSLMTADGEIVITSQRHRTQERNRQDARERLVALIQRAAEPIAPRFATRPTRASRERRLQHKRHHGATKRTRAQHLNAED